MKTTHLTWSVLVAVAFLAPATMRAEETVTNRLTISARLGLNISAKFTGSTAGLPVPITPRPTGYDYYDDGYVRTDISDNYGGQTWYWGYDNSATYPAGQVSDGASFPANTILMSRTTPTGDFTSPSFDSDPQPGFELAYDRHLGKASGVNYGVEVAGNFMQISLRNSSTLVGNATRVTDAYPFTPGTTPPGATPENPYQGSFEGPGFTIGTNFTSSSAVVANGFTVTGTRQIEADLWGARLGPYLDFPVTENLNVWVSGGLAVGLLNADASWNEHINYGTLSVPSSGSGHDDALLWGGYVSANVSWDFTENWSAVGGVQYQILSDYRHNFGARTVEVNLGESFFVTLGLSRRF